MARIEINGKPVGPDLPEHEHFVVLEWLHETGVETLRAVLRHEPFEFDPERAARGLPRAMKK
jgi:hypothetical protein